MASQPQSVYSGSKAIDYFYFQDITFDKPNFHSNLLYAIKGVLYFCSDYKKYDIHELNTTYGAVIMK